MCSRKYVKLFFKNLICTSMISQKSSYFTILYVNKKLLFNCFFFLVNFTRPLTMTDFKSFVTQTQ